MPTGLMALTSQAVIVPSSIFKTIYSHLIKYNKCPTGLFIKNYQLLEYVAKILHFFAAIFYGRKTQKIYTGKSHNNYKNTLCFLKFKKESLQLNHRYLF
jgi:hypothetical protein